MKSPSSTNNLPHKLCPARTDSDNMTDVMGHGFSIALGTVLAAVAALYVIMFHDPASFCAHLLTTSVAQLIYFGKS